MDESQLFCDGHLCKVIPVDQRGLCIGRRSNEVSMPLLDISNEVPELAEVQVKIYRDQFDQWVQSILLVMDSRSWMEPRCILKERFHGRGGDYRSVGFNSHGR